MKSKLTKYPFNKKRYQWDYNKFHKTFEYSWNKGAPKNYETIDPYIEAEPFVKETGHEYGVIDLRQDNNSFIQLEDIDLKENEINPLSQLEYK